MDLATDNRTRPSMAKTQCCLGGSENENSPLQGYNQKLENKNVSKFCGYYKLLGHSIIQCRNVEKKEKKGNTAHKKLKLLRRHKNRVRKILVKIIRQRLGESSANIKENDKLVVVSRIRNKKKRNKKILIRVNKTKITKSEQNSGDSEQQQLYNNNEDL
ncbi:hypothetical protein H5410_024834 [Solanum commersonii]|uniref:Uncharacterized protein n=1 Tax=Solanum commersonii TaxID=4109 RepID=A0A9J5ZN20_SOLCO|nr:hypothetical protein H5410_024834 [Solanum commersonii]